ncbi:MAG: phosphoglycerate dehydrogenase [Candidatus Omnitrophica bacterium]|nr:phosphoglycerate dehydrogenase [Candidatus Omnitrophota bacterium]
MKRKVLVSTSTFADSDDAPLKKLKKSGFEVMLNPYKRKLSKEELMQLLPGVSGLIAGLETLDHEVMSRSQLKVISRCGSGTSNVDKETAGKLGIRVCNTPDGPTDAVAELTIACLLNLLRKVSIMDQALHQGRWEKQTGLQLEGKTVVIIGLGRIGRRVAQLLIPFGARIIGVDPFVNKADASIKILSLQEALPLADIITFHCSGEKCLLSDNEFGLVKKGVFLLNAARGTLVDEKALIEALDTSRVAGVWLDTFGQEPYSGKLIRYSQVLLTPHVGSYTKECRQQMEMQAVNNLIEALAKYEY